ncbi:MAG: MFS transporter, partial [Chitinophagaceae bacterium]
MEKIGIEENKGASNIGKPEFILFIICFLSTAFGGTVSTLMSVYLPIAVKDLMGTKEATELNQISAFINAVFIFGWAIGGFVWGLIGDKIGRKKALLFAIGSFGIATLLTGIMINWEGIVICRMITGFSVGGVLVIAFTYMS